jgi:hypothetical protein
MLKSVVVLIMILHNGIPFNLNYINSVFSHSYIRYHP